MTMLMSGKSFYSWLALAVVLIFGLGGYYGWDYYQQYRAVRDYNASIKKYEDAMRADTAGGKTPKETLDLFVQALRENDEVKACSYFMLDESGSREERCQTLKNLKTRGLFPVMVVDITRDTRPDESARIDENDFKFAVYIKNGDVGTFINMQLNKYSNVWKIESL